MQNLIAINYFGNTLKSSLKHYVTFAAALEQVNLKFQTCFLLIPVFI